MAMPFVMSWRRIFSPVPLRDEFDRPELRPSTVTFAFSEAISTVVCILQSGSRIQHIGSKDLVSFVFDEVSAADSLQVSVEVSRARLFMGVFVYVVICLVNGVDVSIGVLGPEYIYFGCARVF